MYWTLLNQFISYGVQFVIGIIMAKILSPKDYGQTALLAVFISIATILVDCSLVNALIRKPELSEQDLSTVFYYSIIVGLTYYAILYYTSPFIAVFYKAPVIEKSCE